MLNPKVIQNHYPLGIELHSRNLDLVRQLASEKLINHAQVSIPNSGVIKNLKNFHKDLPLYAHSMLLNTLEVNNWDTLKKAAVRIRNFKPKAIIEHFGVFIDRFEKKHAVSFDNRNSNNKIISKAVENLKKWQDLVECPIYLENIPVSKNVEKYFYTFTEVVNKSNIYFAIDLPHFIISYNSTGKSKELMFKDLKYFSPVQVHIGGLSILKNKIFDNHKKISLELISFLNESKILPSLITIEQSYDLSNEYVARKVRDIQNNKIIDKLNLSVVFKAKKNNQYSEELANEKIKNLGLVKCERVKKLDKKKFISKKIEITEKYYPFIYPFQALKKSSKKFSLEENFEKISHLIEISKDFSKWYLKENSNFYLLASNKNNTQLIFNICKEKVINKIPNNAFKEESYHCKDGWKIDLYSILQERRKSHVKKMLLKKIKIGKKRAQEGTSPGL